METRRSWWLEHLALVVTGGAFSFFVMRLVIVAHGDVVTATAIVRYSAPAGVLFGMAVAGGLFFLLFTAMSFGLTVLLFTQDARAGRLRWYAAYGVLCLLVGVLFSVGVGLFYLAIGAGIAAFKEWPRERPAAVTNPSTFRRRLASVIVALMIATLAFGDDGMWLPPEELRIDDGRNVTAYVLDEGEAATVVLHERGRAVERIDPGAIEKRWLCTVQSGSAWRIFRPAHALFDDDTRRYPKCP